MLGDAVPGHVTWVTTALCQKGMLFGNKFATAIDQ
jgi:hypothetical protein